MGAQRLEERIDTETPGRVHQDFASRARSERDQDDAMRVQLLLLFKQSGVAPRREDPGVARKEPLRPVDLRPRHAPRWTATNHRGGSSSPCGEKDRRAGDVRLRSRRALERASMRMCRSLPGSTTSRRRFKSSRSISDWRAAHKPSVRVKDGRLARSGGVCPLSYRCRAVSASLRAALSRALSAPSYADRSTRRHDCHAHAIVWSSAGEALRKDTS